MSSAVGTFTGEYSFCLTGRGLVLLGELSGQVESGYQLAFENGTRWNIKGVSLANLRNRKETIGLLVDAPLATQQELQERGIIGSIAQILAP